MTTGGRESGDLAVAEQSQHQTDHQAGDNEVFEAGVAVAHTSSIG